jgi:hypothetical protein
MSSVYQVDQLLENEKRSRIIGAPQRDEALLATPA